MALGDGLAIGVFAIADTHDFDQVVTLFAIDESPGTHAEAEHGLIKAHELFEVARLALQETIKGLEQSESGVAVNGSKVGAGFNGPANAFSN